MMIQRRTLFVVTCSLVDSYGIRSGIRATGSRRVLTCHVWIRAGLPGSAGAAITISKQTNKQTNKQGLEGSRQGDMDASRAEATHAAPPAVGVGRPQIFALGLQKSGTTIMSRGLAASQQLSYQGETVDNCCRRLAKRGVS